MKFKSGDRIILTDTHFLPGEENPTVASEYFCEGTITIIDSKTTFIVRWDNGMYNRYMESSVDFADAISNQCKSIW